MLVYFMASPAINLPARTAAQQSAVSAAGARARAGARSRSQLLPASAAASSKQAAPPVPLCRCTHLGFGAALTSLIGLIS